MESVQGKCKVFTASRTLKDFSENELRICKDEEFPEHIRGELEIVRIIRNKKESNNLPPLAPRIEIYVGQRKFLDFPALYKDLASLKPDVLEFQRPYILSVNSGNQQLHFIYAVYDQGQWACHQLKISYTSSDEYNSAIGILCGQCLLEGDGFTDIEPLNFANYNIDFSFLDNNTTLADNFNPLLFDYSNSAQSRSYSTESHATDTAPLCSQNPADLNVQIRTLCEQQEFLDFVDSLDKVWKEISEGV